MKILRHVFQSTHNGGKWRTARVSLRCDWTERLTGLQCRNRVAAGEQYFDTNLPKRGLKHVTLRICSECANATIEV